MEKPAKFELPGAELALAPDLGARSVRVACLKAALETRSVAKPSTTIIKEAMEFEDYILGDHPLQQDPDAPEVSSDQPSED